MNGPIPDEEALKLIRSGIQAVVAEAEIWGIGNGRTCTVTDAVMFGPGQGDVVVTV